jgi:hypothetical protein
MKLITPTAAAAILFATALAYSQPTMHLNPPAARTAKASSTAAMARIMTADN